MHLFFCDRTPKQKSKEEPDREAKPGVHAEMDEGDGKVMTQSLLLYFILMFPFGWPGAGFWVQIQSYLPVGRLWANYLITLLGSGGCHCMSVPGT